jgi:hypothetical protein
MKTTRLILLTAALAVLMYLTYRQTHPDVTLRSPQRRNEYVLEVRSIPVTRSLALGEFVIPGKSTRDVKIEVDEKMMKHSRVSGIFSTGSTPGIQVMVLDADHQYLYLSKTATSGNIEAVLPRTGTYNLVFDNSMSETTAHVKADVAVRYEIVQVDSGKGVK